MKSKLLQFASDVFQWRDMEFQPDPSTDDLCLIPDFRRFRFQTINQRERCVILAHGYSLSLPSDPLQRVASGFDYSRLEARTALQHERQGSDVCFSKKNKIPITIISN